MELGMKRETNLFLTHPNRLTLGVPLAYQALRLGELIRVLDLMREEASHTAQPLNRVAFRTPTEMSIIAILGMVIVVTGFY